MENVMNFLADYYIWFFVAAGILFFALIGFIIESKKKQKSEFKGESIEETKEENVNLNTNDNLNNDVEILGDTIDMNGESTLTPEEDTMEINDIPMKEESISNNEPSSIEYYNAPIEMNTPKASPLEPQELDSQYSNENLENTTVFSAQMGEPVRHDSLNQNTNENNITREEKNENINNFDIFEDLK